MAFGEVHSWTFFNLIGAFLDLGLAYLLLCISIFLFFPSKLLHFIGFHLPCPCDGVFGYRNDLYCWHKILFRLPVETIHEVQMLAKSRFPFDLVCFKDQSNLNKNLIEDKNCEKEVIELEDGPCSSSFSSPRIQNLVDGENEYDAKGKRIMNLKYPSRIRRRKKATLQNGKFSSACHGGSLQPVACIASSHCDARETKDKPGQSSGTLAGIKDDFQDDENIFTGRYAGKRTCHTLEFSGPYGESEHMDKRSFSSGTNVSNTQEKMSIIESESGTINMLKQALQKEKAACALLHLELEKERAAAATAADEAMAMISRLQQDKASIEIEARQYQRMIEEKFAYDEDEVGILKEILVRKERENHILKKEIETFRRISFESNGWRSKGESIDVMDDWIGSSSSSVDTYADPMLIKTLNSNSSCEKLRSGVESPSSYETPLVEKQIHSTEHDLFEKTVVFLEKEKEDISNVRCCNIAIEAPQTSIGDEKNIYWDGEELHKDGKHDVHIDGNSNNIMLHAIDDDHATDFV